MAPPARKSIRLPAELYASPGQHFSITIGTYERKPLFSEHRLAERVFRLARDGAPQTEAELNALYLIPDHLHLLMAPTQVSLIKLLDRWKSYTTTVARKNFGILKLWQRSFYDHALRADEERAAVARYILENPVRAGLVRDRRAYPYSWCRLACE